MCELSSSRGPLVLAARYHSTPQESAATFLTAKHVGNYVLSRGEEGEEDLCGGEGESDAVAPQDTSKVEHATAAPALLSCKVCRSCFAQFCGRHPAANPVSSRRWRNSCGGLVALCLRVSRERGCMSALIVFSSCRRQPKCQITYLTFPPHTACVLTHSNLYCTSSSTAPSTDKLRSWPRLLDQLLL